jgi:hypothetical protein
MFMTTSLLVFQISFFISKENIISNCNLKETLNFSQLLLYYFIIAYCGSLIGKIFLIVIFFVVSVFIVMHEQLYYETILVCSIFIILITDLILLQSLTKFYNEKYSICMNSFEIVDSILDNLPFPYCKIKQEKSQFHIVKTNKNFDYNFDKLKDRLLNDAEVDLIYTQGINN